MYGYFAMFILCLCKFYTAAVLHKVLEVKYLADDSSENWNRVKMAPPGPRVLHLDREIIPIFKPKI